MMRNIALDLRLFSDEDGTPTGEPSENVILWMLGVLSRGTLYYLRAHPNTPKLYDSGVKYAVPDQMAECKVEPSKINELGHYLRGIGASEETVMFLQRYVHGIEIFRDLPTLYRRKKGDCFPVNTRFLRLDRGRVERIAGSNLQNGDIIWGRGRWSEVRAVELKGVLPVDGLHLEGDRNFSLTRGHKVFVVNDVGEVRRIAVGQLESGMQTIAPRHTDEPIHGRPRPPMPWRDGQEVWAPFDASTEARIRVLGVDRAVEEVECLDIETDDHTIYLPDENIYVANCDNLTVTRVAELWYAGIAVSPYLTQRIREDGGSTYHALVKWPDGSTEDPSLILGMGGESRAEERKEEIRKNKERYENMLMAAHALLESTPGLSENVLGAQIDALGLIPRDGVFRC